MQSNLRKVQFTNKEDISTSTDNHQEKTNGHIHVRLLNIGEIRVDCFLAFKNGRNLKI